MTKEQLIETVRNYGEAIITYRSAESRKLKYNVCTLDLDDAYIRGKQNRAKETDQTLLLFCWDVDAYRLLNPDSVTKVEPLADALRNTKNGR